MNSYCLPLIFVFLFTPYAIGSSFNHGIQLNTNEIGIQKYTNFWMLDFICTTRVGSCFFDFPLLPSKWTVQNQKIKVPIQDTNKLRGFFLQVTISEPTGNQVSMDLILWFDNGQIQMTVEDSTESNSKKATEKEKKEIRTIDKNLMMKEDEELTWLERNGIVPYLPTIGQLDQVLISGDLLSFSRLVQNILTDKTDCQEKIQYLRAIFERLNEHINYNKNKLQEETSLSGHYTEQLRVLREEREKVLKQIERKGQDNRDKLEAREKELQSERRESYSLFHRYNLISQQYFRKYQQLNLSFESFSPAEEENDGIKDDEEDLARVNKQIESLLKQKKQIEDRIAQKKQKAANKPKMSSRQSQNMKALQDSYLRFQDRAAQYRIEYQTAEKQLVSIREKLENASSNAKFLQERLKKIQSDIRSIQSKTNNLSIRDHQRILDSLNRNIIKIEESVTECEKIINQRNQPQKPIIVVDLRPNAYIDSFQSPYIPPRSRFEKYFIILQKINIFSSQWVLRYGVPKMANFVCESVRRPVRGYGMITGISRGMIRVRNQQNQVIGLQLGICSELMAMSNRHIPEIGDIIDWEGDLVSQVVVNIHLGRIFKDE